MKMTKWLLFLFIFVLAACSPATPVVSPTALPTENSATPAPANDYPVQSSTATAAVDANYPAPGDTGDPVVMSTEILPTVDPNLGQVKGVLIENGVPIAHINLYLAELLKSDAGENVAYAFVRDQAPHALTNEKGEFAFVNVPPNTYALIYDLATKSVLLLDPADNTQIKVLVEAGKSIDFGELKYDVLPTD